MDEGEASVVVEAATIRKLGLTLPVLPIQASVCKTWGQIIPDTLPFKDVMSKRNWALSKWRERQQKDFLGILLTSHVRSVSSTSEAGEGEKGTGTQGA